MTNLCRLLLRQYLTIEVCGIPNSLNRVDSTIFKIICRRRQTARRLEARRRQHRRLDTHVPHLFGLQSKTEVNTIYIYIYWGEDLFPIISAYLYILHGKIHKH
jgi:hypothetical protein